MKKSMMKLALCLTLLVMTLTTAGLAAAETGTRITPDKATLKRMSVFLSNFTEQGLWEIESPEAMAREALVRFGVRHNYVNNYKSRVKPAKNGQNGSLMIDGKWVAESVKKYFALDLQHGSVLESNPQIFYDNKAYHFDGADGEATYYARVKGVFKLPDGDVRMTGELYEVDGKSDTTYPFEAVARPYTFGGKNTWSIVSLHTKTE